MKVGRVQWTLWESKWIKIVDYHLLRGFELQKCKRNGTRLYYYCDEKYEPHHKCKKKQTFLLDGYEKKMEMTCEVENNIRDDDLVVSINAIFGSTSH